MGATISSIILPIVTYDWTPLWRFYYNYIDPFIWVPTPKRIVAINWNKIGTGLYDGVTNVLTSIPPLVVNAVGVLIDYMTILAKSSVYPILIAAPIMVCS